MNKQKIDELADEITESGNGLGKRTYDADTVAEQLTTENGRRDLTRMLQTDIDSYQIATFYSHEDLRLENAENAVRQLEAFCKDMDDR